MCGNIIGGIVDHHCLEVVIVLLLLVELLTINHLRGGVCVVIIGGIVDHHHLRGGVVLLLLVELLTSLEVVLNCISPCVTNTIPMCGTSFSDYFSMLPSYNPHVW